MKKILVTIVLLAAVGVGIRLSTSGKPLLAGVGFVLFIAGAFALLAISLRPLE